MEKKNLKRLALVVIAGLGSLVFAACGTSPLAPTEASAAATLAPGSASTVPSAATSGRNGRNGRQLLPPPDCSFGQELVLEVAFFGKGHLEVVSNYDLTPRGCKPLAWNVWGASSYETFTLRTDRINVFFDGGPASDEAIVVMATTPDGQQTRLSVDPFARQ